MSGFTKIERILFYPAAIVGLMVAIGGWMNPASYPLGLLVLETVCALVLWAAPLIVKKSVLPVRIALWLLLLAVRSCGYRLAIAQ